jgi:hypothetical protein
VIHRTPQADNFWLGCYGGAPGTELGLDSESDGKVATPAAGVSTCSGISTDCIETAFGGMTFDQDECYFDGSDAGLQNPQTYIVCSTPTFTIDVYACAPRNIILNVLVDWNEDGDWNDTFDCSPGCAYEWAVKNHTVALTAGCNTIVVPPFLVGPNPGYGWMRISVSENPAADDYPWNGTLSMVQFLGGETEDYPVVITDATPTDRSSWGRVKTLYR